jgi:uncharacterized membrane protein YbhN (UPF0104 family)
MFSGVSIRTLLTRLLKLLVFAALACFIQDQFRDLDLAQVTRLLGGIGIAAILLFLPYAVVILLDAIGWRECMTGKERIHLREIFIIRLSTDAVMNTFPAGVAFAETLRSVLLRDRFGLRMTDAVAATLLSKINIAVAQMLFVIGGFIIALSLHRTAFTHLGMLSSPAEITVAFIVTGALMGALSLPYSGARLTQLSGLLGRIRVPILQRMITRFHSSLVHIDRYVTAFAREHRPRLFRALGYFLLSWLMMAAETWLILSLLHSGVTFLQAVALEALLSLVKILFFFIPSAMGAQEVGILTILSAYGIPEVAAVAAAFIILRRGKELFWALSGISLFGYLRVNPFKPAFLKA